MRRGIQPRTATIRGSPAWYVRLPNDLRNPGESTTRWFGSDKKAATAFARSLREARVSCGAEFLKLPSTTQAAILNGLSEIGAESLVSAIKSWQAQRPAQERTIEAIIVECIAAKETAGCRRNSIANLKCSLNSFAAFLPGKRLHEITPHDCKTWVYNNQWSPKTRFNRLKDALTLFKYASKHGYVTTNPFETVEPPKVDQAHRLILDTRQCAALLKAAQELDPGLLGVICPVLFGGLRPEEAARMTKSDVKHQFIDLDGSRTKKRRCRTVKMNDSLKAWLAVSGVRFDNVNIAKRMRFIRSQAAAALKRKVFPWAHDILRHTFCSNAVHKFGFKETSSLACTSEDNLRTTYFTAIKDPKQVERFWDLRP